VGGDALRLLLDQYDRDPSLVADALLNPRETTYTLDAFLALLGDCGLAHRSWNRPRLWELETYLDDADLIAEYKQRPSLDQHRIVHHLAGFAGPMLECLVEPADAPAPPPYEIDEILALPFGMVRGHDVWETEGNAYVPQPPVPSHRTRDGMIEIPSGEGLGPPALGRVPESMAPVVKAMDGTRTLREITEKLGRRFHAEAVIRFAAQLLPPLLDVAAPRP
jgi:hypothetical protein